MESLHLPSQLTEEEENLQLKYAKLKKKVSCCVWSCTILVYKIFGSCFDGSCDKDKIDF